MTLKHNSLKGTILPYISIDQFQPKSGSTQEVIVVAFYAIEDGPAKDLNRFIQRGFIDALDSEPSPNPDEEGNYLVFVEFERTPDFIDSLYSLVKDVENVTGKMDWSVKPYLADNEIPLGDTQLTKYIILSPEHYVEKADFVVDEEDIEESVKYFLRHSYISDLTFDSNYVIINETVSARVVDFGPNTVLSEKYKFNNKPVEISVPREVNALWEAIGDAYDTSYIDRKVVIASTHNNNILVLDKFEFYI